jgi:ABC-type Zn uptake system ZnuABC Zn-binding protein ZnuA
MILLIVIFQFISFPGFTQGFEVKINVVTSISVIGEIVKDIGGSRVSVYSILPEGVDPHDYALTVDNIQKASKADLLVFASVENFSLERSILENVPNKPYLDLSDYMHYNAVLLDIPSFQRNFHGYWIKPENALAIAKAVHEKLVELDPDGKDIYDYNLQIFEEKIADLNRFLEKVSEDYNMKNLKVAIAVPGAAYVADAFKMKIASVFLKSPGQFINASELAELEAAIKTSEISLLICPEIMKDAKAGEISEQISRDTGVPVVYVRVFGIDGMNYFELMMYNAGILKGTISYMDGYERFHSDIVLWLYTVLIISVVIAIIEAFVIYKARKKVEMETKLSLKLVSLIL